MIIIWGLMNYPKLNTLEKISKYMGQKVSFDRVFQKNK